jgi:adenosylhomocysteine nucleosidase
MAPPPSLLVTFALREESQPFRRLVGVRAGLAIVETGVGQTNARTALQHALTILAPRWVVTSGFAGALNPKLTCGTVVFDADEDLPFSSRLPVSGAVTARFHCAEHIVVTAAEKRSLRETTGTDAVEMESQVIRTLCRARGIPSATVRVIADAAGEDLPLDFNQLLTSELTLNYAKLAGALARSPSKLAELARFQRRVQAAARTLAQTLAALIADLPAGPG